MNMFSKVFGTRSQREVKRIMPLVEKIESLRPDMQKLSDEELRGNTREFKKRLEEGETLDDLLPEAFAVLTKSLLLSHKYLSTINMRDFGKKNFSHIRKPDSSHCLQRQGNSPEFC